MSATATRSFPDARSLRQHFVVLRRHLRRSTWLRGITLLVALLLSSLLLAGLLDWMLHLPGVVRAVFLAGILAGSGILVYRFLYQPLSQRVDDLTLALRIEDHYPSLNDSLASTIEFLNQAEQGIPGESPSMRREAVRRALATAESCDFERIVDRKHLFSSSVAAFVAANLVWPLFLFAPVLAGTGLVRLLNPFGSELWPTRTQIVLETFRTQIGRGEAFELRGKLRGVIPEQASVIYRLDGFGESRYYFDVKKESDREGQFATQLEPDKIQNTFSFQVHAGDAITQEYVVKVLPPPYLVPLNGETSPQLELEFPEYTGLPSPIKLRPGDGNVEAVLGTVVHLRARADRALKRAYVEYHPEQFFTPLAGFLAPLGATNLPGMLMLTAGGTSTLETVPAELSADRKVLEVTFQPWLNGHYYLHFEDDIGLRSYRKFDLQLKLDPPPVVNLERPSPSKDMLQQPADRRHSSAGVGAGRPLRGPLRVAALSDAQGQRRRCSPGRAGGVCA